MNGMDADLAKRSFNYAFNLLHIGVTSNILESLGYSLEDTDELSEALLAEGMEMEKKAFFAVTEIKKIILPLLVELEEWT